MTVSEIYLLKQSLKKAVRTSEKRNLGWTNGKFVSIVPLPVYAGKKQNYYENASHLGIDSTKRKSVIHSFELQVKVLS